MAFSNNTSRRKRSADTYRKELIDVAIRTRTVIDHLTFDLSSYFRVQYVVMFALHGVPFSLREFMVAAYYITRFKPFTYAAEVALMCPHIRKTTVQTMIDGVFVVGLGKKNLPGKGRPVEAFVLTGYWEKKIEIGLREAKNTIREMNYKERQKQKNSTTETENSDTDSIDFGSIFDELE